MKRVMKLIRSMTGFGRAELINEEQKVIVEMKAVNHRYCDINIRMPRHFSIFENNLRATIKKSILRGKIDVYITYEDYSQETKTLKYNYNIAKEYYNILKTMSKQFDLENDIKVSNLSRYPEILTIEEQSIDKDAILNTLTNVIEEAVNKLVDTREVEGKLLSDDLITKLNNMKELLEQIEAKSPSIINEYKEKLENRIKELIDNPVIDENRLASEIVIYADKSCIDEEIVRLDSHIKHMNKTLEANKEGIGRKLDFIAQEMNREANTILSKANDMVISNCAIELKTEIEKIREQIQNIE